MQAKGDSIPPDGPLARVVKYVPVDIVGAWVAISAALASKEDASHTALLWGVFAVLLVVTPIWIIRQTQADNHDPARTQALVAAIAFGVWVFALGGPFARYDFYDPAYGTVALVLFSLGAAMVVPTEA